MSFPTDGFSVTGAIGSISANNNDTLEESQIDFVFSNLQGTDVQFAAVQAGIDAMRDALAAAIPGSTGHSHVNYQSQIMG